MSGNTKYTVPLGIDSENVVNPLNQVISTLENVQGAATDANKTMQQGFNQVEKSANSLESRLSPISRGLESVKQLGKQAGKELSDAFNERNVNPQKLEAAVASFQNKLNGLTANVDVEINPAKMTAFNQQIDNAKNEVEQLEVALKVAKEVMNGLDPNSAEFQQLSEAVTFTDTALTEFAKNANSVDESNKVLASGNVNLKSTFEDVYGDLQPMNTRLGEMEDRMYELKLAGQENTAEFKELQAETIKYRKVIQEVDAAVDNYAKSSARIEALVQGASGLVGAFTAVQGATALLAGENENLNAVIAKVTGAMAVLQGIQEVMALFDKDSAFSVFFLSSSRAAQAETTLAAAGATSVNTQATAINTIATGANIDATVVNSIATESNIVATSVDTGTTTLNTGATITNTGAQLANTASVAENTLAEGANSIATTFNTTATLVNASANDQNTAASITLAAAEAALTAAVLAESEAEAAATAAILARAAANTEETATAEAAALATLAQANAARSLAQAELAAVAGAQANVGAQAAQSVGMGAATIAANILGFALKAIGIGLIITAIAALVEYWDELGDAMKSLLPTGTSIGKLFDKIKSYAFGVGEAVVKFIINPFKAAYQAMTGDFEGAWQTIKEGWDVKSNFEKGKQRQDLRNNEKYLNEKEQQDIDARRRELERAKNRGQDVYDEEQKLYKRQAELNKKTRKDNEENNKAMEDAQDKHYAETQRKAEAARRKAEQEAKAAAAKAAAERKRNLDLISKYNTEIRKLAIYNDGEENDPEIDRKYLIEREALWADYMNRLEDLEKDNPTSPDAIRRKNQMAFYIELSYKNQLKDMEKRQNTEIAALKLESLKTMNDLNKEGREKDLESAELDAQASIASIREKFEREYALREFLVLKTEQDLAKKKQAINLKYNQQEINDNLEKATLLLELSKGSGKLSEKQEEQHQLALLQIQKEAADQQLALLVDSGKDQNDIEVLNARLRVKQVQDAIADEAKKGKKFDMFEFLGITGNWTPEQKDMIVNTATDMLDNLSKIADGIVEQYQRQIDKKQEVIDQYNNDIDNLEGQLDKEKDLRDQGLANNVETLEAEIVAKKAARDEEIRQQQELQKKQEAIQKAQMIADTAFQLVGLITSSVNIIKGFSTIPIIGLPLGIAAVAAMFGAFAFAKVRAFQAVGQANKMRKGGLVDGASHEHGGKKYYANDGSVTELEGGEYVNSVDSTKKYYKLLHAANTGDWSNVTFADLGTMGVLGAMGVSFSNKNVDDAVVESRDLQAVRAVVNAGSNGSYYDFNKMDDNIAYLAQKKKDEAETWEDNNFYYRKKGTRVTQTRKK